MCVHVVDRNRQKKVIFPGVAQPICMSIDGHKIPFSYCQWKSKQVLKQWRPMGRWKYSNITFAEKTWLGESEIPDFCCWQQTYQSLVWSKPLCPILKLSYWNCIVVGARHCWYIYVSSFFNSEYAHLQCYKSLSLLPAVFNPCVSDPCAGGGICDVHSRTAYVCKCPPGYPTCDPPSNLVP